MPSKINEDVRAVVRTSPGLERARKQTRSYEYVGEVVAVNGSHLAGSYVWVRPIGGIDTGQTAIRNTPTKVLAPLGVATIVEVGRKVYVSRNPAGQHHINGNVAQDLIDAGINIRQLNPVDPQRKFSTLENSVNFNAFPDPNNGNAIVVTGGIYRRVDGLFGTYAGETGYDILTANKPSTSDTQVIACIWLDPAAGALTTTVSSEVSQNTNLYQSPVTAIGYINECAALAPDGAVGIWSFILKDDDTEITNLSKYRDLRGLVNAPVSGNLPRVLDGPYTVRSNDQMVITELTVTDGTLTVDGAIHIL